MIAFTTKFYRFIYELRIGIAAYAAAGYFDFCNFIINQYSVLPPKLVPRIC